MVELDPQAVGDLLALGLAAPEEAALAVGMSFGDYALVRLLGHGGSGVVFEAVHAGLHPRVAIKLMKGHELATRRELQRFRDGAAAAADLVHPNIVPVFHVGERSGRPFFTMALLECGNLEQALE